MSRIWIVFLVVSIISALANRRTAALSAAVLEGASAGITLAVSLAGPLCLWSGLNKLLEQRFWITAKALACAYPFDLPLDKR